MHPYSYNHPHHPLPAQDGAAQIPPTSLHQHYQQGQQYAQQQQEHDYYQQQQWNGGQGGVVWVAEQAPTAAGGGGGYDAGRVGGYGGQQDQYDYSAVSQQPQPPMQAAAYHPYAFSPPPAPQAPLANSSLSTYASHVQPSSQYHPSVPYDMAAAPPAPSLSHPQHFPAPLPPSNTAPSPYAHPSHLPPTHSPANPYARPPPSVLLPPHPPQPSQPLPAVAETTTSGANKKRRVSFAVPSPPGVEHPSPSMGSSSNKGGGGRKDSGYSSTSASTPTAGERGSISVSYRRSVDASGPTSSSSAAVVAVAGTAGTGLGGVKNEDEGAETASGGKEGSKEPTTKVERAEKSCKHCRARKVRCTRTWPSCQRCIDRKLECHYGNLIPIDLVKNMNPSTRVAELEARIKTLELDLAASQSQSRPSPIPSSSSFPFCSSSFTSPSPPSPGQQPLSQALSHALLSPLSSFPSSPLSSPSGRVVHARAVLETVLRRAGPVGVPWEGSGRYGPPTAQGVGGGGRGGGGVGEKEGEGQEHQKEETEEEKVWGEWRKLVLQDEREAREMLALLDGLEPFDEEEGVRDEEKELEREDVVQGWMAEGRWARWVSWGALDAFWSTCSSNTPTFRPFHSPHRKLRLYAQIDSLPLAERVVVCAFAAVGVRGCPGVEFIGLAYGSSSSPSTSTDSPSSPSSPSSPTVPASPAAADESPTAPVDPSLAVKRELQTRSVRSLMLALYDELEVGVGEGTVAALEATAVCGVVMMWNELIPRRSRSFVRIALGMYRDLIDSFSAAAAEAEVEGDAERKKCAEGKVEETVGMFGLPLLVQDSTTAAYLRSSPLITTADLSTYFSAFPLPTFPPSSASSSSPPAAPAELKDDIANFVDLDRLEGAEHMPLLMGSMMVWKWLAGCLRKVAEISCPKNMSLPLPPSALNSLFQTLTSLHTALQTFQHHLCSLSTIHAHPTCLIDGPEGDTCESVHLRWCTRLDREVDDAVWLVYGAVGERMWREQERGQLVGTGGKGAGEKEEKMVQGEGEGVGEEEEEVVGKESGRLDVGWLEMCESRLRKGLKLAAFYFNFFLISPDPHQTHHLAWGLELIPHWTFLATQRYTPPSTPLSSTSSTTTPRPTTGTIHSLSRKSDELTEVELDWIEAGLVEACKYHPVAERRLVELRAYRAGNQARSSRDDGGEGSVFPARPTPTIESVLRSTSPASFLSAPSTNTTSITSGGGSTTETTPSVPSFPSVGGGAEQQQHGQPQLKEGQQLGFQQAMQIALKMSVPSWA